MNTNEIQWWKNKNGYTDVIKSGFYIIDKNFCKKNIKLTSNNKSDSVIETKYIYI